MKSIKSLFKKNKPRKRGIHATRRTLQLKIAEYIYPSIGMTGLLKYLFLSLKRKPVSSHSLALGFAFGVLVSFTPYVGLHGLLAIFLAYIFSASMVSAILGTIVGNPWTFPLIWAWTLKLGNIILQNKPVTNHHLESWSAQHLINNIAAYWDKYLLPMTLGGIPTGIIASIVCYFIIKYEIDKFRQLRQSILKKRKAELRAKKFNNFKETIKETFESK